MLNFKKYDTISLSINQKPYTLWVANNNMKRVKGLSKIKDIPVNYGMIFVFDTADSRKFTMKETYIPLRIIFLNNSGNFIKSVLGIPRDDALINCHEKCRYVIEIPEPTE